MLVSRRSLGAALLGLSALGRTAAAAPAAERRVRVFSTTDRLAAQPLIDSFDRLYPAHAVDYRQMGSVELYDRFIEGKAAEADVLWSSAMDLQIKLVNDGHALRHESPHGEHLPRWAVWKNEAFGTTQEPVGIIYHRQRVAPHEVPGTHLALAALLRSDSARFRGRVATYDIERAGLGYLLAAHDAMVTPKYWDLAGALAECRASLHADTQSMLDGVASGRFALAHNVLGSYAEAFARKNADLGVAYLNDYTLVISRVAFIARGAPNPQGAQLWLDHLLSYPGQRLLTEASGLFGVRADASGPRSAAVLGQLLGPAARPITLGPALLANLDRSKHDAFLKRWRGVFDYAR